jgi:hypothetical protein
MMPESKITTKCGSEKSLPDDVEKDAMGAPTVGVDDVQDEKPKGGLTASGDRALVLMDLDSGLVGWDNDNDPENPQ